MKLLVEAEEPARGARGELIVCNGEFLNGGSRPVLRSSTAEGGRQEALSGTSNSEHLEPAILKLDLKRPLHLTVRSSRPSTFKSDPTVLQFRLPPNVRSFEDLALKLDGQPCDGTSSDSGDRVLRVHIPSDGQKHVIAVSYLARGRDRWEYATAPEGSPYIPLIRNFTMTATANFSDIDYPKGSVSPVKRATVTAGNASAAWQYNNLRANQRMGLEMPMRQNAGPVAARMSYFAPVSLFFFFTVLFTIVLLKQINLHPMHYLFIAAGFFAFHILLAYLVDLVDLEVAFWICAAVSVVLVVSYMRLVGGVRFAVLYVGLAQLVYLIGFSYAFLWKGHTGLTVVIGAIVTLFVLMQSTGRINWSEVFGGRRPTGQFVAPPPPVPPQP